MKETRERAGQRCKTKRRVEQGRNNIGEKARGSTHIIILILHRSTSSSSILILSSLLSLTPLLPLPDVLEELHTVSLDSLGLLHHIRVPKLPDQPLEDVSHFPLEVVLVVVGPSEEGWDESVEVRVDVRGREGNDDDLDESERGLDDLSVVGGDEDDESGDKVVDHGRGDGVCKRGRRERSQKRKRRKDAFEERETHP